MSHDERGSTGTTAVFLLLGIVLGAALGYWYASRARVEPPPAPAPRSREVSFEQKDKRLTDKHPPIYLTADRGDKIVWRSNTVKNFKVTVKPAPPDWDKEWYEASCAPGGPKNPFQSPTADFQGVDGRAQSGAAKPEAKGHCYKYTITPTTPGVKPLDPHIIFD